MVWRLRPWLLLPAGLALGSGVWAGLVRLGWAWRLPRSAWAGNHGALMVAGFLGTLICLERAVALRQARAYGPAIAAALGTTMLVLGLPVSWAGVLLTGGALGLGLLYWPGLTTGGPAPLPGEAPAAIRPWKAPTHHLVMAAGAGLWLGGNILWLSGRALVQVVPWWAGFLLFTIAGERLELSRILRPPRPVRALLLLGVAIYVAGAALAVALPGAGVRLAAAGSLLLALWLLRFDLARRNLRRSGLTRYIAVCLVTGYAWLAVSGLLGLIFGAAGSLDGGASTAGPLNDARLHAFFLGFVFSLILAHAPLLFPAVSGRRLAYSWRFYAPLILLQFSLGLRLAGDLLAQTTWRRWGGLFNAVSLLLFILITAAASRGHAADSPDLA